MASPGLWHVRHALQHRSAMIVMLQLRVLPADSSAWHRLRDLYSRSRLVATDTTSSTRPTRQKQRLAEHICSLN